MQFRWDWIYIRIYTHVAHEKSIHISTFFNYDAVVICFGGLASFIFAPWTAKFYKMTCIRSLRMENIRIIPKPQREGFIVKLGLPLSPSTTFCNLFCLGVQIGLEIPILTDSDPKRLQINSDIWKFQKKFNWNWNKKVYQDSENSEFQNILKVQA